MGMKKLFSLLMITLLITLSLYSSPSKENKSSEPINNTAVALEATKDDTKKEYSLSDMMYAMMSLYSYIDNNFVFDKDSEEMMYSLIEGMIDSLGDQYSYFTRPENSEHYAEDRLGTFTGIGIYYTKANPALANDDPASYMAVVTAPFPGGPADRARIKAHDMISHVDGIDLAPLTSDETVKLIKGEAGTPVTLTIHRGSSVFDVTIIRETVNTPVTASTVIDNEIGYIRLTSFTKSSEDAVRAALKKLVERNIKGLILDLRNNSGGLTDDAVGIANMFISEGTILITEANENSTLGGSTTYNATQYLMLSEDIPMVILVNEGTASASEILTAALKDNNRAIVVGTQTYGKGIMQTVLPYLGGYISMTTYRYLTPRGASIHGIGITPDYIVEDIHYSDEDNANYASFISNNRDATAQWIKDYPENTEENIEAFAEYYKSSNVPPDVLRLLIKNAYIYSADDYSIGEAFVDPIYDPQLKKAIEIIRESL